jgi:hypothetical protein
MLQSQSAQILYHTSPNYRVSANQLTISAAIPSRAFTLEEMRDAIEQHRITCAMQHLFGVLGKRQLWVRIGHAPH